MRSSLLLFIIAILPVLPALMTGGYVGDQYSELPVKLWVYQYFAELGRFFGGSIDVLQYPKTGVLNNPDIFGTTFMTILGPLKENLRYNLMIVFFQWLNMEGIRRVAKYWTKSESASIGGAICFGLSAGIQGYILGGAITDMLHLWPYPFAIWAGLRALNENSKKWAMASGVLLGLGVISCPYNFVILSPVAIPIVLWMALKKNRADYPLWSKKSIPILGVIFLSFALSGGLYILKLSSIIGADNSQMSTEMIQSTRHYWPFKRLLPFQNDHYVATLTDYFLWGDAQMIVRDSGARFYRSYTLGITAISIGLWGVFKSKEWLWLSVLMLGILASIGPYLSLSESVYLDKPSNPIYLMLYTAWPGTNMILEPFRYQLLATFGLSMMVAMGLSNLSKGYQWGGTALIIAEMVVLSTAPFPQPITEVNRDPFYDLVPQDVDGAIIELPYFRNESRLFVREHFTHQRQHGLPIVNGVEGFLPALFFENPLLATLMKGDAPHPVPIPAHPSLEEGASRLYELGFRGIIVTPSEYSNSEQHIQSNQILNKYFGPPIRQSDGHILYVIGP